MSPATILEAVKALLVIFGLTGCAVHPVDSGHQAVGVEYSTAPQPAAPVIIRTVKGAHDLF